jgi:signal transduction histidine kinase
MMNCNVIGNILGQIARTRRRFQAPYLLEFVGESRRCLSGRHGLATAGSIVVDKHGGSLSYDSLVGQGTTFKTLLSIGGTASADRIPEP